jgi:hypothetical protein
MNISSAVKTAKTVITANSPVLLVGTAIAGVVATGVLAAKGGYKARGIIDEARMSRVASPVGPFDTFADYREAYDEYAKDALDLTVSEKVQLTWLCYAVPGVTALSTIASVVGVHTIHTKRSAVMAGMYALTSSKLDDVQTKAEEMLGAKKAQVLKDDVGQKAIDRTQLVEDEVIITPFGTELFYDDFCGRYFTSSVSKVEEAVNTVNREIIKEGSASVNFFYDILGLEENTVGAQFGWGGKDEVRVSFGGVLDKKTQRSAVAMWFQSAPKTGYIQ